MTLRVLFYTIDLALLLNIFLVFTLAAYFVLYTKAIIRLIHYKI